MTEYKITVKPGASRTEVREVGPEELVIYLQARAHDGEANTALIQTLAKHFKIPKTSIEIIRGTKSRQKVIRF
ncbi:DUF167 domain-containing protein [Candidatus Saccharibacteria bacterium]|nr:DUF167 domain-containing protein [Candidatus Saccharibacteria bacterium]